MESTTITPVYVYVSATQPSDLTEGKLWYNTTDTSLYACDGATYNQVIASDINQLTNAVLENQLAILDIQATDTLTSGSSANIFRDVYSDSGGYLNTINIGSTTADFNSIQKNYANGRTQVNGTARTNTADSGLTDDGSKTAKQGVKFTMNAGQTAEGIRIVCLTGVLADTAYILDSSKNVLASAPITGGVANVIYDLVASTTYYAVVGSASGTQRYRKAEANFPLNYTEFNIVANLADGTSDTTATKYDIATIATIVTAPVTPANSIVQTNEETITAGATKFQIFTWKPVTAGSGTITYDISFDGGSNYQTGISANTETTITNTGTGLIVKQNLNGTGAGNTAQASGFGVMFW